MKAVTRPGAPRLTHLYQFAANCLAILLHPRRAIRSINSTATIADGVAVASLFGGLYALAALIAYRTGHKPHARLFTFVPLERYYLVQTFYTLPMTLLWMAIFARFVRGLSTRLRGTGRLGGDFTMLAFTQAMPMIALFWIPDVVSYLLRIDDARYYRLVSLYGPAAVGWAFLLSTAGIAETESISWPKALLAVAISEVSSAVASGAALLIR